MSTQPPRGLSLKSISALNHTPLGGGKHMRWRAGAGIRGAHTYWPLGPEPRKARVRPRLPSSRHISKIASPFRSRMLPLLGTYQARYIASFRRRGFATPPTGSAAADRRASRYPWREIGARAEKHAILPTGAPYRTPIRPARNSNRRNMSGFRSTGHSAAVLVSLLKRRFRRKRVR